MVRTRQPELTRAALLQAARQVVREQGAALSLDAVARAAGVSKGGLLHHFPSRDALLQALALALVEQFREELEAAYARECEAHGAHPGAWLRAYIALTFCEGEEDTALHRALVPLAGQPALLEALAQAQVFLLERAEADGVPAGAAHAVRLACDGFWLAELTGQPRLSAAQTQTLREALTAWTR
ncbi:TetR/AcrR family transcriptional regulator [Deinococcus multiflagellatus]|uniref:TetR/AcrR family transcriptional regulator n=1 Tax=Deinococcus multiflagellatus TaxID=1656887 RepID=UPI001CCCD3D6|nr:TetR/AcrR family transcriptional regulator [Deinococcus multiflagellatus]MBZ9711865.1 TetR/AcrR family transcriptional regulator [Deinococcus multiflagellatus]